MSPARLAGILALQLSCACAIATDPVRAPAVDPGDQRCIDQEEQLADLTATYGKRILILEGAFKRSTCERSNTRPIDQTRIALTRSHLVIFGPHDDIHTLLELAEQNAKVLAEVLPATISQPGRVKGITPNTSQAPAQAILQTIGVLCPLSGTIESADAETYSNFLTDLAVLPRCGRLLCDLRHQPHEGWRRYRRPPSTQRQVERFSSASRRAS